MEEPTAGLTQVANNVISDLFRTIYCVIFILFLPA